MPDVTITALSNDAAPTDYDVPPAQEIVVKLASAMFDGSGASGDFVPVLEVVSPDRKVVGSFPIGAALAAGASAFVSWFPRGGAAVGGGGAGIRFDTFPQVGDWLYVESSGVGSPDNLGISLHSDATSGGVGLTDDGSVGVQISTNGNGPLQVIDFGGGGVTVKTEAASSNGVSVEVDAAGNTGGIGINDKGQAGIAIFTDTSAGQGNGPLTVTAEGTGGITVASNGSGDVQLQQNTGVGTLVQLSGTLGYVLDTGAQSPRLMADHGIQSVLVANGVEILPSIKLVSYTVEPPALTASGAQGEAVIYLYDDGVNPAQLKVRIAAVNGSQAVTVLTSS